MGIFQFWAPYMIQILLNLSHISDMQQKATYDRVRPFVIHPAHVSSAVDDVLAYPQVLLGSHIHYFGVSQQV